ncbi:MAG: hypothetical protein JEZ11_06400 [Desulfobacterales bacterium]|nr:hypothetical protein [Desulfobacterales bacterium]
MDSSPSATPLNQYTLGDKDNETQPAMVVPSCCGIPKRATDLCDHCRLHPPVPTYDSK